MHNPEAVQYILDKKKTFIKKGKKYLFNLEKAEECYQILLETLLKNPKDIEHIPTYTFTSYFRIMYRFYKYEERYYLVQDSRVNMDDEETHISAFDGLLQDKQFEIEEHKQNLEHYEINKQIFLELVGYLPTSQKTALLNRYNGTHKNTNTEKANFRVGFLKLQNMIQEREYV